MCVPSSARASTTLSNNLFSERKNNHEKALSAQGSRLRQLRCQNEETINKIDGVQKAEVSFMMQKLTVEADEDRFDEIMKEIVKTCRRVEPDCEIVL